MERIKAPLVIVPLVLIIIHWGAIPFFLLVLAGVCVATLELYRLMELRNWRPQKLLGLLGSGILSLSFFLYPGFLSGELCGFVFAILLFLLLGECVIKRDVKFGVISIAVTIFGIAYVPGLLSHLILLRDLRPHGESLVYLLFISTWCIDTGAYWVGINFGKHKLSPVISPHKSWEGAISGFLTGIGIVYAYRAASGIKFLTRINPNMSLAFISPSHCLAIGILLGIGGQLGDLAESLIKRSTGVKDSGNLFPGGHGGMLDKVDSLMFNAPLLYYYVQLFLK